MDIYDFFNSPDVADYCRSIGHKFNAIESAVMVSQSKNHTLAEKHDAYRAIIAEHPDMELPETFNYGYVSSIHKALEDVIVSEQRGLEDFLTHKPGMVYRVTAIDKNPRNNKYGSEDFRELYQSYEEAIADAMSCYESDFIADIAIGYYVRKTCISSKKESVVQVSASGKIFEIDFGAGRLPLLESYYIDVPVPFKKGDLVEVDYCASWMGGVYVLQDTCRDDTERNMSSILQTDISDMIANVHYADDGVIACECIHFYPDLKYCRRELVGDERILKYVSLYMKDELCLCHLLEAQKYLLADRMKNEVDKPLNEDLMAMLMSAEKSNPKDIKMKLVETLTNS